VGGSVNQHKGLLRFGRCTLAFMRKHHWPNKLLIRSNIGILSWACQELIPEPLESAAAKSLQKPLDKTQR
jgi:hypothetical protein